MFSGFRVSLSYLVSIEEKEKKDVACEHEVMFKGRKKKNTFLIQNWPIYI